MEMKAEDTEDPYLKRIGYYEKDKTKGGGGQ
jgi:hypothetical protein